jgi:hypothetical protein
MYIRAGAGHASRTVLRVTGPPAALGAAAHRETRTGPPGPAAA